MKKTTRLSFATVVLIGVTLATISFSAPKSDKKTDKPWSQKMSSLQKTLIELYPRMLKISEYQSRREKRKTLKLFEKFSKSAHSLSGTNMTNMPDPDPTIKLVSELFEREVEATQYDLKSGFPHFARDRFLSLTNYCFACHTTSNFGPEFSAFEKDSDFKDMSDFEKGLFYSSTRRFVDSYGQFIKEIENEKRSIHWQEAIYRALTIAVRVKKDPALADNVISKVLAMKDAPLFVIEDAKKWADSVKKWKKERNRRISSESGYFHEAIRLMDEGKNAQEYSLDKSGMVYFLRASSVLHDALRANPKGKRFNEFLYLLGQCYDALSSLRIWNLANQYYEMCIEHAPHTQWSHACYRRYEQNIVFGYTGSAGTDVPDDVEKQMVRLRALSQPKK